MEPETMDLTNFRPSYPDNRSTGYRLGSYLWAECVGDREHDDGQGVDVGYLIYTQNMKRAPAWTAIDKVLDELTEEYKSVILVEDRQPGIASGPGKRAIFVPLIRCRHRRTKSAWEEAWEKIRAWLGSRG
jgi:hypothetical protein